MGPNLSNPVLLSTGDLQVEGTFDTHGEVLDDVLIRFVLIPDGHPEALTDPLAGSAVIANAALTQPDPACRIQHGIFSATVPNKFGLAVGAKVRGIGLSVAVKRSDPRGPTEPPIQDPPAFETFVWCLNLVVEAP